jgi:hypothetical protein
MRVRKWLIALGYGVWGAAGFFFICAGVNPILGAFIGLAFGVVIGLIHGVGYRDAWSGAALWAARGSFLGAMGTVGATFACYALFFPGFHDDQDIIVFCAIGIVVGAIGGAAFGWYLGREHEE